MLRLLYRSRRTLFFAAEEPPSAETEAKVPPAKAPKWKLERKDPNKKLTEENHPLVNTPEPIIVRQDLIDQLSESIASLNMLEYQALADSLMDRLGVSPEMLATSFGGGGGGGGETAEAKAEPEAPPEPTHFDVKLVGFEASKKIAVIRELRGALEGVNLMQAKQMMDALPKVLKTSLEKEEAEELKKKLEDVGAQIELEA